MLLELNELEGWRPSDDEAPENAPTVRRRKAITIIKIIIIIIKQETGKGKTILERVVQFGLLLGLSGASSAMADDVLDYGKYLSGECTTCHRLDGVDNGIPNIIGMDKETFMVVMKAYQTGDLTNQAMVSVAKSLEDDQLKALAAYFSSLKSKEKQ